MREKLVARILLINDNKIDLSEVSLILQNSYNALIFPKTIEDSLRMVGSQSIDLVLLSLPRTQSTLFLDYFAVLRQLCGVIPIIGVAEKDNLSFMNHYADIGLDDFAHLPISKNALFRKIRVLTGTKQMFDDNLLGSMSFKEKRSQKMVIIFHDNLDFLDERIRKRTEITQLKSWPTIDDISDADLFLINNNSAQACECCANLRLRKSNRYKPIVLSYDKGNKSSLKQSMGLDIGITDIINVSAHPAIIACRLNSLMKYKKMYESFSNKLKNSLYLSAIDPTTGVYNRSFFDEYIKNRVEGLKNAAVLIIDVDKFKLINDEHGHSFGDFMLKYVSNTIKRYIRSSDLIARYGGDEFVIYMDNVTKNTASDIARRIQRTVENSQFKDVSCTVSIGVCYADSNSNLNIKKAISIADKFMYISKENGRNAVSVCA